MAPPTTATGHRGYQISAGPGEVYVYDLEGLSAVPFRSAAAARDEIDRRIDVGVERRHGFLRWTERDLSTFTATATYAGYRIERGFFGPSSLDIAYRVTDYKGFAMTLRHTASPPRRMSLAAVADVLDAIMDEFGAPPTGARGAAVGR